MTHGENQYVLTMQGSVVGGGVGSVGDGEGGGVGHVLDISKSSLVTTKLKRKHNFRYS